MNKGLITKGFARTVKSYSANATIQKEMSRHLAQLIADYCLIHPTEILEIGCGTGFLTTEILHKFPYSNFTINDINSEVEESIKQIFVHAFLKPSFIFHDAETFNFTQTYNLICSSSCFQWFTNQSKFFSNIAKHITKDGLFAFSTFGPENMREIKATTTQGLEYFTIEQYQTVLVPHFATIYSHQDTITMYFPTAIDVLKHIKATGVNGAFCQHWTKGCLQEFSNNYERLKTDLGYPLTYHPIYFICKPL